MKERIFWLDIVRCFAIILVVFTHVHENVYIENKMLVSLFYSIDRIGVPLFFMLSGGLILPKIADIDILTFYKKRIPQFFILIIVWSIMTNFSKAILVDNSSFKEAISTAIQYNGIYPGSYSSAAQMWFMYTIIELYLIAPFLARLLNKLSNYYIMIFISICFILNQFKTDLVFFLEKLHIGGGESLQKFGSDFTGAYLIYFILGYLIIYRNFFSKKNYITSVFMIFLPIMLNLCIDLILNDVIFIFHWYSTSIFIVISSIGMLILMRDLFKDSKQKNFVVNRFITLISIYSFGIYLSHYCFIFVGMKIINFYSINAGNQYYLMFIYFIFSFIGGFTLTHLLMKNKYTKFFVA
ncbi:acyltransferase [Avibacterium paragallinarum]|uniref:Acyltransferase n=1 Tax=Avibacterium paragallinarum TaxID=728 RepID=A0ABU7QMW5_AVIPA|nr:acyltransferase [Avibacterium paragallinarum]